MSFFNELSELIGEEYSLDLSIRVKNGKVMVSAIPIMLTKNVNVKFQSIVVSGTPRELDIGFIQAIKSPLKGVDKLLVSGDSFVKEEKKSTPKKQEAKPVEKKEEKPKPEPEPVNKDLAGLEDEEWGEDPVAEGKVPESAGESADSKQAEEPVLEENETFDENTGEVMGAATEIDDSDLAQEPKTVKKPPETEPEPEKEEEKDDGQIEMFNDDDWG